MRHAIALFTLASAVGCGPSVEPSSGDVGAPTLLPEVVAPDTTPTSPDVAPVLEVVAEPANALVAPPPADVMVVPAGPPVVSLAMNRSGKLVVVGRADTIQVAGAALVDGPKTLPRASEAATMTLHRVAMNADGRVVAALSLAPDQGKTKLALVEAWRQIDARWTLVLVVPVSGTTTPILVLANDGSKVAAAGYDARAWLVPEAPTPGTPEPIVHMPRAKGWYLPDGDLNDASRIIELQQANTYGVLVAGFNSYAAAQKDDRFVQLYNAKPLPLFSNAAVLDYGGTWAAPTLDAKLGFTAWRIFERRLTPLEYHLPAGRTTLLALGPRGVLIRDAVEGLVYVDGVERERPFVAPHRDALQAALGDDTVALVLPDGAVHVLPLPKPPPPFELALTTELDSLPAHTRALFAPEGFVVRGQVTATQQPVPHGVKTQRTPLESLCAAAYVEHAEGLWHAEVRCEKLDVKGAASFAGHWYATATTLWRNDTTALDRISIVRRSVTVPEAGACVSTYQPGSEPISNVWCFDKKGPKSAERKSGAAFTTLYASTVRPVAH